MADQLKPLWEGFAHVFLETGASEGPSRVEVPPIIFPYSPLILLTYAATYFFLHCFGGLMGRFCFLASLIQSLMVGIPVTSSLTGFELSALLYQLAVPVLQWSRSYNMIASILGPFGNLASGNLTQLSYTLFMVTFVILLTCSIGCFTLYKIVQVVLHAQQGTQGTLDKNHQVQIIILNPISTSTPTNEDHHQIFMTLLYAVTMFEAEEEKYHQDLQKVTHVANSLTGKARKWFATANLQDPDYTTTMAVSARNSSPLSKKVLIPCNSAKNSIVAARDAARYWNMPRSSLNSRIRSP